MAKPVIVEGATATNPQTGERIVYTKGKWYPLGADGQAGGPSPPGGMMADASQRGRTALGLGPSVNAEQTMSTDERGGNPLQHGWGATLLAGMHMDDLAKMLGGDDYQRYVTASKSFESSLLPIFSGSAVTPSEAQRFIRANLPEFGDSPATLETKSKNRRMILNAAAHITGAQLPFPQVPTWGVPTGNAPGGAGQPAARPGGQQLKTRSGALVTVTPLE